MLISSGIMRPTAEVRAREGSGRRGGAERRTGERKSSRPFLVQAISSYLDVCALGTALAMVLVLDLAAPAALTGLCGARAFAKGGALRRERSSRSAKGHAKRQHKCCDQQRYTLLHLLTSSALLAFTSPKQKPASKDRNDP